MDCNSFKLYPVHVFFNGPSTVNSPLCNRSIMYLSTLPSTRVILIYPKIEPLVKLSVFSSPVWSHFLSRWVSSARNFALTWSSSFGFYSENTSASKMADSNWSVIDSRSAFIALGEFAEPQPIATTQINTVKPLLKKEKLSYIERSNYVTMWYYQSPVQGIDGGVTCGATLSYGGTSLALLYGRDE